MGSAVAPASAARLRLLRFGSVLTAVKLGLR